MKISSWSAEELALRLAGEGLVLETGPVRLHVRCDLPGIAAPFRFHYGALEPLPADVLVDGQLLLSRGGWRGRLTGRARLFLDGDPLFPSFPLRLSYPYLEWGMNHAALRRMPGYLALHAAALHHHGAGVVLPGASGSGKSTLAAGLAGRGWSLYSDELAVLDLEQGHLVDLGRPVTLKNQALEEIPRLFPQSRLGPLFAETRKGRVGHVSVAARGGPGVAPFFLVFPRFVPGARLAFTPLDKGEAFTRLTGLAFNYRECGFDGFRILGDFVARAHCRQLEHGCLEEAMDCLDSLVRHGTD